MIKEEGRNHDDNLYLKELNKFINKEVIVVKNNGEKFLGTCKAIAYNHLNIVLMTEQEKILIKDISHMIRIRDSVLQKGDEVKE